MTEDLLTTYRHRVLRQTEFVSIKGIPTVSRPFERLNFPLDRVYIQVQAVEAEQQQRRREADETILAAQAAPKAGQERRDDLLEIQRKLGEKLYQQGETVQAERPLQPIDPAEALNRYRRLVILGAPGAGKSTLLRFLARQAALQPAGPLPILISVREYATDERRLSLRQFAVEQASNDDDWLGQAIEQQIEQQQVIWLVDGLDEAGGEAEWVVRQAGELPGQLVITSRPIGYPHGILLDIHFKHFEILPLLADQRDQFLRNWFDVMAGQLNRSPTWVVEQVETLQAKIAGRPRLAPILRHPLLLTFLAILFAERPEMALPESRAALYGQYIEELLLGHWKSSAAYTKMSRNKPNTNSTI